MAEIGFQFCSISFWYLFSEWIFSILYICVTKVIKWTQTCHFKIKFFCSLWDLDFGKFIFSEVIPNRHPKYNFLPNIRFLICFPEVSLVLLEFWNQSFAASPRYGIREVVPPWWSDFKLTSLEHSKTQSPDEMHPTHRQDIGKVSLWGSLFLR